MFGTSLALSLVARRLGLTRRAISRAISPAGDLLPANRQPKTGVQQQSSRKGENAELDFASHQQVTFELARRPPNIEQRISCGASACVSTGIPAIPGASTAEAHCQRVLNLTT